MVSANQKIELFADRTSDGEGDAFLLTPISKDQPRIYEIVLDDDLGAGVFQMKVSLDYDLDNVAGATFVNWLICDELFQQTIIGFGHAIVVHTPMLVRGNLTSSTNPNLNANLFTRHQVKPNLAAPTTPVT